MGKRDVARRRAESEVLHRLSHRGQTATAREIALEMGWPWQIVARALQRLAAANRVTREELVRKDRRSRIRRVVRFKPIARSPDNLPQWLQPKIADVVGAHLIHGHANADEDEF
jgi:hypothetical protein